MENAFVTLATNDTYCVGAMVVGASLRRVHTQHHIVCMIGPGVSQHMRKKLEDLFDYVYLVDILDSRDTDNLYLLDRPDLGVTFTKLHCWRLVQYKKCVFLDADTLVLCNCDELFDREELSAAPDPGWPDCFNSGVFVYVPNNDTYNDLVELAVTEGSFDGGDQGLLNMFFKDWAYTDISKHLPFLYNVVSQAFYSYLPAFKKFGSQARICHFIGPYKPWHHDYDETTRTPVSRTGTGYDDNFLRLWWNIFISDVVPLLTNQIAPESSESSCSNVVMQQGIARKHQEPGVVLSNGVEKADAQFKITTAVEYEAMMAVEAKATPEIESEATTAAGLNGNIAVGLNGNTPVHSDRYSEAAVVRPVHYGSAAVGSTTHDAGASMTDTSVQGRITLSQTIRTTANLESPDSGGIQTASTNQELLERIMPQLRGLGVNKDMISTKSLSERQTDWESGTVDYTGVDSFENIRRQLDAKLSETPSTSGPSYWTLGSSAPHPAKSAVKPIKGVLKKPKDSAEPLQITPLKSVLKKPKEPSERPQSSLLPKQTSILKSSAITSELLQLSMLTAGKVDEELLPSEGNVTSLQKPEDKEEPVSTDPTVPVSTDSTMPADPLMLPSVEEKTEHAGARPKTNPN